MNLNEWQIQPYTQPREKITFFMNDINKIVTPDYITSDENLTREESYVRLMKQRLERLLEETA